VVALPGPEPGEELAAALACSDPALASMLCGQRDSMATVAPGHHDRLALVSVPTGNERVLFYRVASAGAPLQQGQIRRIHRRGE
jgi:hypothetical protein